MLLVHKAHHPTAFMAPNQLSPPHHHKRNPSAPAAVVHVHPTKTPGLLSLSKPAAVSNRSQQHPRHSTPRQHKTKPAASTTATTGSNSTPEKRDQHQPRGRGGPPKDKSARNGSRARHEHGTNRQPSPTPLPPSVGQQQQTTPAAPAPSDNNTNNSTEAPSKPDASPSLPATGGKQPVVLTDQPSGRLAKRRNNKRQATPQPLPFPSATPPKQTSLNNAGRSPSPVKQQQQQQKTANVDIKKGGRRARPTSVTNIPLSRSVPIPSNVHGANRNHRRNRRNGGNHSDLDVFPICDDNDEEYDTEPTTPTRPTGAGVVKRTGLGVTWQTPTIFDFSDPEDDSGNISFGENGPRTAPLSSQQNEAKHYFPSPVPSPSPRSRQQQQTQHGSLRRQRPSHARMTSYPTAHQVFNVSADELLSFPHHAATPPLGGATTATPVKSMGSKNDILALFGLLDKNGNAFSTPSPASASADGARPRTISGDNNAHPNRGNGNVIGGGLYASSTFQNSPSPEALPPPDLVFGEGDDLFGQN